MNLSTMSRAYQLLMRILDSRTATEPFLPVRAEKLLLPLQPPIQPLPRCTPEAVGLSSHHLRKFLEELSAPDLYAQTVLVLRYGKVVCEASYGGQTTHAAKYTFSACKSLVSLAVGLLVDDGVLKVTDSVAGLLGELVPPSASARRRLRGMTVEDLLTMRTGVQFSETEAMTRTEWAKGFVNASFRSDPGKEFSYNSMNTYMLAYIVREKMGESLSSFLQRRLFDPMGITGILWETCPDGVEKGGWGLYIRPEDFAKLGQLVMDGGWWQGHSLISSEYLLAATARHSFPPPSIGTFDYGYQIWTGRRDNAFLFNGMLGQNVLGFRDSGILVVTNAGEDATFQQSRYFEIASRYFGGTFPPSLPADPPAWDRLRESIAAFSDYNRPEEPLTPAADMFLNRSFVTADPRAVAVGLLPVSLQALYNNYTKGVSSVAVSVRGGLPELIYRERDSTYRFPVGLGRPVITPLDFRGNIFQCAALGRFTRDEDNRPVFCIRLEFLETPSVRTLKLRLSGNGLSSNGNDMWLEQGETPGVPFLYEKLTAAAQQPLYKPLLLMAAGGVEEDFLLYKTRQLLTPRLRFECRN